MQNPTQYLVIIVLMAYIIFKRIMRAVNFQKYSKQMLIFRGGLYSVIAFILLALAVLNPLSYVYFAIGAIAGGVLVYVAVKNMVFEKRKDGLYYRTHVWVEVGILALFFARLAYRFYSVYSATSGEAPEKISQRLQYASDPFTGFVFFLLCTYYVGYYLSVYKKSTEALQTLPEFVDEKKNATGF